MSIGCDVLLGTVFILMLAMTLRNRERHVNLINSLEMACTNVKIKTCKLHWRNIAVGAVYFLLSILEMLMNSGSLSNVAIVYNFTIGCALTNVYVAMLHIQDIANVLTEAMECCLSHSWSENIDTLSDLCDIKDDFQKCFGCQLLLNSVSDSLVALTMCFYLIAQIVFLVDEVDGEDLLLFSVYVVPIVAKNVWMVSVIASLENQVFQYYF